MFPHVSAALQNGRLVCEGASHRATIFNVFICSTDSSMIAYDSVWSSADSQTDKNEPLLPQSHSLQKNVAFPRVADLMPTNRERCLALALGDGVQWHIAAESLLRHKLLLRMRRRKRDPGSLCPVGECSEKLSVIGPRKQMFGKGLCKPFFSVRSGLRMRGAVLQSIRLAL